MYVHVCMDMYLKISRRSGTKRSCCLSLYKGACRIKIRQDAHSIIRCNVLFFMVYSAGRLLSLMRGPVSGFCNKTRELALVTARRALIPASTLFRPIKQYESIAACTDREGREWFVKSMLYEERRVR